MLGIYIYIYIYEKCAFEIANVIIYPISLSWKIKMCNYQHLKLKPYYQNAFENNDIFQ
jgi:hypothetical protein